MVSRFLTTSVSITGFDKAAGIFAYPTIGQSSTEMRNIQRKVYNCGFNSLLYNYAASEVRSLNPVSLLYVLYVLLAFHQYNKV